jgi:hypothetical protein
MSLLTPYVETEEHGPNFTGEPAELLPTDEEYDVEEILDSKPTRNKKGTQYLIKWLDYPESENTWLPTSNLANVMDMVERFHNEHPTAFRHR